jgi:hypothetical protein
MQLSSSRGPCNSSARSRSKSKSKASSPLSPQTLHRLQTLAATVPKAYRDGEHNGNANNGPTPEAPSSAPATAATAGHVEASLIAAASVEAAAAVGESMPRSATADAVTTLPDKLEDMTGK